jgi:drug/metabolite transporter (DMT)-like permease
LFGYTGKSANTSNNEDFFEEKVETKIVVQNEETHEAKIETVTKIVKRDLLKSGATFVDYGKVVICGFIGIVLNFLTFFYAVQMTTQIIIAAEMCLFPFVVYVLGYFTQNETYSIEKVVVTVILIVGNIFLTELWQIFDLTNDTTTNFSSNNITTNSSSTGNNVILSQSSKLFGAFLMFLSVCCFAIYVVFQKPLVKKFNLVDFMMVVMITGAIGFIVLSLMFRDHIIMHQLLSGRLSRISWIAILYAGTVQSSGTFFLISYCTEKLQAPLFTALMSNSSPVFVVLIAINFLGETMDKSQIVGAFIVMVGVAISIYISVQSKIKEQQEKEDKEKDKEMENAVSAAATVVEVNEEKNIKK